MGWDTLSWGSECRMDCMSQKDRSKQNANMEGRKMYFVVAWRKAEIMQVDKNNVDADIINV